MTPLNPNGLEGSTTCWKGVHSTGRELRWNILNYSIRGIRCIFLAGDETIFGDCRAHCVRSQRHIITNTIYETRVRLVSCICFSDTPLHPYSDTIFTLCALRNTPYALLHTLYSLVSDTCFAILPTVYCLLLNLVVLNSNIYLGHTLWYIDIDILSSLDISL